MVPLIQAQTRSLDDLLVAGFEVGLFLLDLIELLLSREFLIGLASNCLFSAIAIFALSEVTAVR